MTHNLSRISVVQVGEGITCYTNNIFWCHLRAFYAFLYVQIDDFLVYKGRCAISKHPCVLSIWQIGCAVIQEYGLKVHGKKSEVLCITGVLRNRRWKLAQLILMK